MIRRPAPPAAFLLTAAAAVAAGPPETVTGTVLDAAGDPVAGAAVGTVTDDGPAFTTTTAADGSYALPKVGAWGVRVARGPGGELAMTGVGANAVDRDGPAGVGGGDAARILRLAPPAIVTVAVRTAEGRPAPGVPVLAMATYTVDAVAATGPDGTAELRLPAGSPLRAVVAVRPGAGFGYALTERPGPGEDAPPPPDRVDVRLSPTFTHRVRCVTTDPATGETVPAAGARVSVWTVSQPGRASYVNLSGVGFAKTVTGPDGVATFDWLPKDFENAIPLWVGGGTLPGGRYGRVRSYVGRDPFVSPEDAAEHIPGEHAVALEPLATIAGRVTNPDGSPAAGVPVLASGIYSGPPFPEDEREATVTDPDGRYELTVRGNAAFLVAPLPGAASAYDAEAEPAGGLAAATAGREEAVVAPPGGRRDDVDFALAPGARFSGRVTRGGEPVAGATVRVTQVGTFPEALKDPAVRFGHDLRLTRRTNADADGRYAVRLGPGTYYADSGDGGRYDPDDTFTVAGPDDAPTENFELDPLPVPVEYAGIVTDEFGLSLAGLTVAVAGDRGEIVAPRGRPPATTRSGADGTFAVTYTKPAWNTDRGAYLTVSGADAVRGPVFGYLDLVPRFASRPVAEPTGLTLVARRLTTLTGRLLGPEGRPLAGVRVSANPADVWDSLAADDPLHRRGVTGPAGRFLFDQVVCGTEQRVFFHDPDGRTRHFAAAVSPDGAAVTRLGPARGLVGAADVPRPPVANRRAATFAEPDDLPAALAALRADAELLDRDALLLVADPASDAGRDLFDALYEDAKLGAAADARFLTRCLAADRPTRPTTLAELLNTALDPAAATLVAVDPGGTVLGTYTHTTGERDAVRAFLEGRERTR